VSDVTTTEPSVETRRQIAESIARRGVPYSWLNNEDEYRAALNWFANEIEAALKERDERAVKIAETHEGHGVWCASASGDCQSLTIKAIAAAIRND
jgi:hypothetical protein